MSRVPPDEEGVIGPTESPEGHLDDSNMASWAVNAYRYLDSSLRKPHVVGILFLAFGATYFFLPHVVTHYYIWQYGKLPSLDADRDLTWVANETARDVLPEIPFGVITLTVQEFPHVDMLLNFHESATRAGVYNVAIMTFDNHTHSFLTNRSIYSYLEKDFIDFTDMDGVNERKLGFIKFIFIIRMLKLGHAVFYCDSDTVFLDYPYVEFTCADCDFEIGPLKDDDDTSMNVGMVLFRPTIWTVRFLEHFLFHLYTHPNLLAHETFQHYMMKFPYLRHRVLPSDTFLTAHLQEKYYAKKGILPLKIINSRMKVSMCIKHCERIKVFQCSIWLPGYYEKRFRLRELAQWKHDGGKYYSNSSAKYLTYDNPVPHLYHMERFYLGVALKIAAMFNRTLILPELHCPGSGRKLCSLAELTDIEQFEQEHHPFREHSFLDNPLVPWDVVSSISHPVFIRSSAMETYLHLFRLPHDVDIFQPFHYPKGPTKEELRRWLQPYGHYAVLRLHSIYFNISDN